MTVLNFPASPKVNDTYTENGVVYTWNGSYWSANNASDLGNIYVAIAGDRMTGQLELPGGGGETEALQRQEVQLLIDAGGGGGGGGDLYWERDAGALSPKVSTDNVDIGDGNITLNAADGKVIAANRFESGGAVRGQFRGFYDAGNAALASAFVAEYAGDDAINLRYDGSSEFAGDMAIGTTGSFTPSTPAISLNADGNAAFKNIRISPLDLTGPGDAVLSLRHTLPVANDYPQGFTLGGVSEGRDTDGYNARAYFAIKSSIRNGSPVELLTLDHNGSAEFANITLNADGSITAAGNATFGDYSATAGARVASSGSIVSRKEVSGSRLQVAIGNEVNSTEYAFSINPVGSAALVNVTEWDGSIKIGGTVPSAPNITLAAGGDITTVGRIVGDRFTGLRVYANSNIKSGNGVTFRAADVDGTVGFRVSDRGTVQVGGTLDSATPDNKPNVELNATTGDIQSTSQNGGQLAGFRNLVQNGSYVIDQRTGGATINDNDTAYAIDRWAGYSSQAGSSGSVVRSSETVAEFPYSLSVTTGSGASRGLELVQGIELDKTGFMGPFIANGIYTVSFYAKTTVSDFAKVSRARFSGGIAGTGGVTNVVVTEVTAHPGDGAWHKCEYQLTMPASIDASSIAMYLYLGSFSPMAGGSSCKFSGVQLEIGPVATPFEHRPIATELALCQRYYQVVVFNRVIFNGNSSSSTTSAYQASPTEMRTTSQTVTNAAGDMHLYHSGGRYEGDLTKNTKSAISSAGISRGRAAITIDRLSATSTANFQTVGGPVDVYMFFFNAEL